MNTQTDQQDDADPSSKGDVIQALSHLTGSISDAVEILDQLSKRLDPILLDSPDPSLKAVAQEAQSRSPLAGDLHQQTSRIIAHRLLLERLCDMIQL